jgi:hypothetical protein
LPEVGAHMWRSTRESRRLYPGGGRRKALIHSENTHARAAAPNPPQPNLDVDGHPLFLM